MKSKLQGATSAHRFYLVCTCYPVGANIVRPQHDRSLCKVKPQRSFSIFHYSEKKNSVPLYPSGTL